MKQSIALLHRFAEAFDAQEREASGVV
jgi:hypothetical protein